MSARGGGRCDFVAAWAQTVGAMADMRDSGWTGYSVRAICNNAKCPSHRRPVREVDVDRLIAEKGRDYSLVGRRSPCSEPGCGGYVRFFYQHGAMRGLWRDEDVARWLARDWAARKAKENDT